MPYCQRSNAVLDARCEEKPGVWRCPGHAPYCPGEEIYRLVSDGSEAEAFERALAACSAEFGRRPDRPIRLWLGLQPLTVPNADSLDVYVMAEATPRQLRGQAAHESVHATHDAVMHWTHEMLAVCFAVRYLHTTGDTEYVLERYEPHLRERAAVISAADLLAWDRWPAYPIADIYGRVFVIGEALIADTSWEDVKRLASTDLDGWLDSLDGPKRLRAQRTLKGLARAA